MFARCNIPIAVAHAAVLVATFVSAAFAGPKDGVRAPESRLIVTEIPAGAEVDSELLPLGSRIVVRAGADSVSRAVLTPDFSSAGRSDVSFDGKRILFVGRRKPGDPQAVWEMGIDGSSPRLVTTGPRHCISAVYLSTIYTIDSAKPALQIAVCGRTRPGDPPDMYTCRLDGSRLRRITFAPGGAFDPLALGDGRLLFGDGKSSLFTVNTDGTDVFIFAKSAGIPTMACETREREVVFVELRNRLVAVSSARSLTTRRVVAEAGDGAFLSPTVLADGRLLVSYRSDDDATFGVCLVGQSREVVFDSPDWHEVFAKPVRPRSVPAGRSSSVRDGRKSGVLYCLDAYLTGTTRADATGDRRIARVRVMCATVSSGGTVADPLGTVLGEIPVESDGSFALEVPARMPLRLLTLNGQGDVLREMQSWLWVMPNENRGCIGCHEDRELTPTNRFVRALRTPPRRVGLDTESRNAEP